MRYLPLFAGLADQNCLLFGGNETATRKLRLLVRAGTRPVVLATNVVREIQSAVDSGDIMPQSYGFIASDLHDVTLVVVSKAEQNEAKAIGAFVVRRARFQASSSVTADRPNFGAAAMIQRDRPLSGGMIIDAIPVRENRIVYAVLDNSRGQDGGWIIGISNHASSAPRNSSSNHRPLALLYHAPEFRLHALENDHGYQSRTPPRRPCLCLAVGRPFGPARGSG